MRVDWLVNASSETDYHESARGEYRSGVFETRFYIATVVALCTGGCAATAPQTPASVATAYIEQLAQRNETRARALRAGANPVLSDDEFEPARKSRSEVVRDLARVAAWDEPESLEVARRSDGTGWQIRSGVLASFAALSPEACLERLIEAIATRDASLLKTLVPEELEATISPRELESALLLPSWSKLSRALAARELRWLSRGSERAEVEVEVGDEAHTLVLVREGNVWKVFDVRPWKGYLPR
jgi:hypothetical protein